MPAAGVDQRDAHRRPPGGGQAEQVDSGQRPAGAAADDGDDRPAAADRGVAVTHVFETHIHNDYVTARAGTGPVPPLRCWRPPATR
jgi:glyoxylase-like metal-dependent hydrolase (beta-lactamase superfamily II)